MKLKTLLALSAIALCTGAVAQNSNQGVSKTEITIGSIQDLSGPIAGFGKQVRLGMMLRVDEINEQGGVGGRKIKLIVEDSAYDPKKAVLAAQKLVNQDKIFAMIGHIGTAQNLAMPVQFEKNVINFFPVTAAREMYDPFHRLKYSFAATYYDQMRTAARSWSRKKAPRRSAPCTRTTSSAWKSCAALKTA
jgi:branched-chain amino acid transport system substrate-binding protein